MLTRNGFDKRICHFDNESFTMRERSSGMEALKYNAPSKFDTEGHKPDSHVVNFIVKWIRSFKD